MEEIPEDVRKAAQIEASRWFLSIGSDSYHFADAIARAILAERERCWRLADSMFYPDETKISARIRDAIRSGVRP